MSNIISRHRPVDASAAAVEASIDGLKAERATLLRKIESDEARRAALLIDGADKDIAAVESEIRNARLNIERIHATIPALERQLDDALAAEAAAEREAEMRTAAEATEQFNAWFDAEYAKAAAVIAEGVELERVATRLRDCVRDPVTGVMASGLPDLRLAFVGQQGRGLGFLTRLPGVEPGRGIVWP